MYGGDILVHSAGYDDRNWRSNMSAHEIIFQVTLDSLIRISVYEVVDYEKKPVII